MRCNERIRIAVAAAIAATTGFTVAMAHGESRVGSPAKPSRSDLATFRRPHTAADTVPGNLVHGLVLDDGTADVAESRRVRAGTSHEGWLMPGRRGSICHVRRGFATCPPARLIEARGAAAALGLRDGRFLLDGVASDRVRSVEVSFRDGSSTTLGVVDNVFSVESSSPPVTVAWDGPSGRETADFGWYIDLLDQLQRDALRNRERADSSP